MHVISFTRYCNTTFGASNQQKLMSLQYFNIQVNITSEIFIVPAIVSIIILQSMNAWIQTCTLEQDGGLRRAEWSQLLQASS